MKATLTLDTQDLVTAIRQGTLLLLGQGLLDAEKEGEKEIKGSPEEVPKEKAPETPKAEAVSVDELRRLFKEKNTKANRPKLKAILDTVGADSVSAIKEEDYSEVILALKKIEA